MKKLQLGITAISFLFIVVSCASIKGLSNNKYVYKSKNRTLEIYFKDNSTGVLTNTFECPDIEPKFKILTFEYTYLRKGDTIFLNNINSDNNENLYLDIPPQESNMCDFLNMENRKRDSNVGPSYATDYEKYGLVPNLNQDTLYIVKNKIVFFKKNKNQSIGFIFK